MITDRDGIDRFESAEELISHLERGDEIEFRYNNQNYWMMRHKTSAGNYILYKPYDEASECNFNTPNDLLEHQLDGKPIQQIINVLEVLHTNL